MTPFCRRITLAGLAYGLTTSLLLTSTPALAWGPIGHRMIAETAAILVHRDSAPDSRDSKARNAKKVWWGNLFNRHRFELGYYAFVPDAIFRHEADQLEPPTHYFDVDLALGQKISELRDTPETFQKLVKLSPPDLSKLTSTAKKAGTVPWRVQEFHDLALQELKPIQKVKGGYQPGQSDPQGASKINQTLFLMGVMAHYTGDSTMPYHATLDYNGWDTDQAGIHFFFESDCVNALEPGLSEQVLKLAFEKKKDWLKAWNATSLTPLQLVLKVLIDSAVQVPELARVDREKVVLKPSKKGTKAFAERRDADQACEAFRPLLTQQLAKGAVLTAALWERIDSSPEAQKIDVSEAKDLQFSDLKANPKYISPSP
ncbi:MAG: hypothetical protein H7222_01900 [Methylotenera sp.]|nr:hypothetical protein [Oligoflexia bacterium]